MKDLSIVTINALSNALSCVYKNASSDYLSMIAVVLPSRKRTRTELNFLVLFVFVLFIFTTVVFICCYTYSQFNRVLAFLVTLNK